MPAAISRSLRSPRVVIALCMIFCIGLCAVFANRIAPNDPGDQNLLSILTPPIWSDGGDPNFLLGTDSLGRDVLSRLIYGARTAMLVALFASLGAMIIGAILAHIAAEIAGDVRENGADDHGAEGSEQRHQHRGACAVDEPRQYVPAEAVGAERITRIAAVCPGRRDEDRQQILVAGIVRRERSGKDRAARNAECHGEREEHSGRSQRAAERSAHQRTRSFGLSTT